MTKLDKGTFGGTKASHWLADKLNEKGNKKYVGKVSGIYHSFTRNVKALNAITESQTFIYLLNLLREQNNKKIAACISHGLPKDIGGLLRNVCMVHFHKSHEIGLRWTAREQEEHDKTSRRCSYCGQGNVKWALMSGKEVACDNCVPRGCSCQRELKDGIDIESEEAKNKESYYDLTDEKGRKLPCCEWWEVE